MNIVEIHKKVLEQLKERRSEAVQTANYNNYKMLKRKEYLHIANKIGELTIELAKAMVSNNDTTELQQQLDKAKENEKVILNKYNMTKEDLEPKYTCILCNDKGVIDGNYCKCYNDLINKYSNQCNDVVTYSDCNKIDSKYINILKQITSNYAKDKHICNILIAGSVGAGKTYLTRAMQNDLEKQNIFTLFTTATSLNNNFLEYHKCFDDTKNVYIQPYIDCDALIIDDLGTEPMLNNVTKEYMLMLISERIQQGKLTIITTNLKGNEFIERYGERLFSRLFDKSKSITLNIQGKDLRLKEK
ncbi:MAG: ATP-binding protein [Christensenellales bacterium]